MSNQNKTVHPFMTLDGAAKEIDRLNAENQALAAEVESLKASAPAQASQGVSANPNFSLDSLKAFIESTVNSAVDGKVEAKAEYKKDKEDMAEEDMDKEEKMEDKKDDDESKALASENAKLKAELKDFQDRFAVLEKAADVNPLPTFTVPEPNTVQDIESLKAQACAIQDPKAQAKFWDTYITPLENKQGIDLAAKVQYGSVGDVL